MNSMQDSSGCNKGSFRHTAPPRSWTPPCCLQLGPSERTRHCTRRNFQQMDKQTDKQSANRQCSAPRAHMRGSASTILRLDKHAKPPQIWHDFSLLPFCLLIISPLVPPPNSCPGLDAVMPQVFAVTGLFNDNFFFLTVGSQKF